MNLGSPTSLSGDYKYRHNPLNEFNLHRMTRTTDSLSIIPGMSITNLGGVDLVRHVTTRRWLSLDGRQGG